MKCALAVVSLTFAGGCAVSFPDLPLADAGPPCALQTIEFDATADTELVMNSDAIHGGDPIAGVDASLGIEGAMRFDLLDVVTAFTGGQVQSLVLGLNRVTSSLYCIGTCPANPGTILAYPLRNDWSEPSANWPDRTTGGPWGAPGATSAMDHGGVAATFAVQGTEATLSVSLDVKAFGDWIDPSTGQLSVILVPVTDDGGAGAAYAYATKENTTVKPEHLDVSFCSGDL